MKKAYFPMFVDISEKQILVIGGGKIAGRRIKTLLMFAQYITVVAPQIDETIRALAQRDEIVVIEREWQEEDVKNADIVLTVTDNQEVNSQVVKICKANGILVNTADDKAQCDFYFPGVVIKDDVTIGIGTNGKDPARAKAVRQQLEGSDFLI